MGSGASTAEHYLQPAGRKFIFTASLDGSIFVYNRVSRQKLSTIQVGTPLLRIDVKKRTSTLAAAGENGIIFILRGTKDDEYRVVRRLKGHTKRAWDVKYSPRCRFLASTGDDKQVIVRNARSYKVLRKLAFDDLVKEICFTRKEDCIFVACWNKIIYAYNLPLGQPLKQFIGHSSYVNCLRVSPDGSTLFSAGADKILRVWDTASGGEKTALGDHKDWIVCMAIRDDGKFLLTGSVDKRVRVWDLMQAQSILEIVTPEKPTVVEFALEGGGFVIACGLAIYNVDGTTGRPTSEFENHTEEANGLSF